MELLRSEDDLLPDWLKENLSMNCDVCGSPLVDYYNEDYRCTNTCCSNPACPSLLASRANFVCSMLGTKGIGYATLLQYFKQHPEYKTHMDVLYLFSTKPKVTVAQYLRIACLKGIDSQWENICLKVGGRNFSEFYERYKGGKYFSLLEENAELLQKYSSLVEFPAPEFSTSQETIYITIMITGTPIGFASKEQFINKLNQLMQGRIVLIHQATKRQTGVDYLIREPGSTTRGKVEAALRGGIPIVTSQEFISILTERMEKILGVTSTCDKKD